MVLECHKRVVKLNLFLIAVFCVISGYFRSCETVFDCEKPLVYIYLQQVT